jgi:hypothetical protein
VRCSSNIAHRCYVVLLLCNFVATCQSVSKRKTRLDSSWAVQPVFETLLSQYYYCAYSSMVREEVHAARNTITTLGVLAISDSTRTKKRQCLLLIATLGVVVFCLGGLFVSSKLTSAYQRNSIDFRGKTIKTDGFLGPHGEGANVNHHPPIKVENGHRKRTFNVM